MIGAKTTQIEVKHHARKFGTTKYGLSRIYKVLLDLIAMKTIWSAFNKPLYGFGVSAVVFVFLSFIVFLGTVIKLFLNPGESIIIISGISMLLGELSIFLFTLGFICELTNRTSSVKIENIIKTSKSIEII
jgi:hypothetical protein